jgi:hypothetical protein
MKGWRVYFEFYGRQLVTEVDARNEHEAKERVKERIVFLKVKELPDHPLPTPPTPLKGGNKEGKNPPTKPPLTPPKEGKGKTIMDFIYGFRKF